MSESEYHTSIDRIGELMDPWRPMLKEAIFIVRISWVGNGVMLLNWLLSHMPLDEAVGERLWQWAEEATKVVYSARNR